MLSVNGCEAGEQATKAGGRVEGTEKNLGEDKKTAEEKTTAHEASSEARSGRKTRKGESDNGFGRRAIRECATGTKMMAVKKIERTHVGQRSFLACWTSGHLFDGYKSRVAARACARGSKRMGPRW